MAINQFPTVLQPIIQQGYLEHEFQQALRSKLAYRTVADQEPFISRIGETLTKTRAGLLSSATTPINPTTGAATPTGSTTNLDNGLTPDQYGVEQFTITINQYAKTMNLNTVGDSVGLASQFIQNGAALGENAARTMDDLSRDALFGPYLGGNTRVTVTLGAPGTAVKVDDIRGFLFVPVNGVMTAVNGTNYLAVTIGAGVYNVVSVAADGTNASTAAAALGISGTLTLSANVSVSDGTAGNAVVSAIAPAIVRSANRATTAALVAADQFTMANILDAKTYLELNAVPTVDGFYNCFVDPKSSRQLFADSDFKQLFQGATTEAQAYKMGAVEVPFLGVRLIRTTEAYVQPHPTLANVKVRRPIICGKGALIEGNFDGESNRPAGAENAEIMVVDGVEMIVRPPLDRLAQNIAQSWSWIGGFCAPTDVTTSPTTVATATNSALKRAVVIEHAG